MAMTLPPPLFFQPGAAERRWLAVDSVRLGDGGRGRWSDRGRQWRVRRKLGQATTFEKRVGGRLRIGQEVVADGLGIELLAVGSLRHGHEAEGEAVPAHAVRRAVSGGADAHGDGHGHEGEHGKV